MALKLRTSYAGPALRVRRAANNVESDVAFTAGGQVDVAALSAFCTSSDCYVSKLYDQSGNARDLAQATAAKQIKIYDGASTSLVGGGALPVLVVGGTNQTLTRNDTLGLSGNPAFTIAYVGRYVAPTPNGDDVYPFRIATPYLGSPANQLWVGYIGTFVSVIQYGGGTDAGWTVANSNQRHRGVLLHAAGAPVNGTIFRFNGTPLAQTRSINGTVPFTLTSPGTTSIGQDPASSSLASAELSSLLVWNSVLGASDLTTVESSLNPGVPAPGGPGTLGSILGSSLIEYWDARAGTTLVGGGVSSWVGQVKGTTVYAPSAPARPAYAADGTQFKGLPVVQCSGGQYLDGSFGANLVPSGGYPYMAFVGRIRAPKTDTSQASLVAFNHNYAAATTADAGIAIKIDPSQKWNMYLRYSGVSPELSSTNTHDTAAHLFEFEQKPDTGMRLYIDGVLALTYGEGTSWPLWYTTQPQYAPFDRATFCTVPGLSSTTQLSLAQVLIASSAPTPSQRLALLAQARTDFGVGYCGDGVVGAGEQCDDGNRVHNDACDNTCKTSSTVGDQIETILGANLVEWWDARVGQTVVNGGVDAWMGQKKGVTVRPVGQRPAYAADGAFFNGRPVVQTAITGSKYLYAGLDEDLVPSGSRPYIAVVHRRLTPLNQTTSFDYRRVVDLESYPTGPNSKVSMLAMYDFREGNPPRIGTAAAYTALSPDLGTQFLSGIDDPTPTPVLSEYWVAADGLHYALNGVERGIAAAASQPIQMALRRVTIGAEPTGPSQFTDASYAQVVVASAVPTAAQRASLLSYEVSEWGIRYCGDGVVTAPEQCDDGNTVENDGCNSACKVPTVLSATLSPASIFGSSLVELWDARAGQTVTPDNQVMAWTGQVRGTTVRPPTANNRPSYAADGTLFGGQPVVQTAALTRALSATSPAPLVAAGTRPYFAVVGRVRTPVTGAVGATAVSFRHNVPSASEDSRIDWTVMSDHHFSALYRYQGGTRQPESALVHDTLPHLFEYILDAGEGVSLYIDGARVAQSTDSVSVQALYAGLDQVAFGAAMSGTTPTIQNVDLSLAQVLLLSARPSADQRAAFRAYARTHWAVASCGDGILDNNEQCDDGNVNDGDGCSSACTTVGSTTNTALLDTIEPAVGAYSVALKLSSSYTGAALRVRRASDGAQQDIAFTAGNVVDTAAIRTFCGASDCFVATLYDQSGFGRNLLQNTTANQYRIYVAAQQNVLQADGQPVLSTEGAVRWLVSSTAAGNGLTPAGAMTMAYRGRVAAVPAVVAQTYHLDGWSTALAMPLAVPTQIGVGYDSGAVLANASTITSTHNAVVYKDANANVGSTVMRLNGAQLAFASTSNPTTVPRLGDQTLVLGDDGVQGAHGTTEISTFLLWDRVLTTRDITVVESGLGGGPAGVCAANAACSEQCPCEAGKQCSDDLACRRDLTCRTDVADRFGLAAGTGVCWDPECDFPTSPRFSCGSTTALCGNCPGGCTPNCSDLQCGSNGCYGDCGVLCDIGGHGCDDNTDCANSTCAIDENGETVCVDDICDHPGTNPCSDPANAGLSTSCGTCAQCTPDCTNRNCGPSPDGCGSCDTATLDPATQYCSGEGHIQFRVAFAKSSENLTDAAQVAGTLPGQFTVDPNGQARYTLPLSVPPGRNGLAPELALTYNSAAGNGYLGQGWSLSGFSSIERCPKTVAQDGIAAPVTYTKSDRYCLDGQRLVLEDGNATYGANGTAYRTEIDELSRVVSYEPANAAEPNRFEVRTRDGRIMTYDFRVAGHRPLRNGAYDPNFTYKDKTTVRSQSWLLTQVQDRFGNTMRISYFVPPAAGDGTFLGGITQTIDVARTFVSTFGGGAREYYPERIDYNLNTDAAGNWRLESDRSVRFHYRTRREVLTGYRHGVRFERTKVLDRITAFAQGEQIYRYDLAYDEPAVDGLGKVRSDQLQVRTRLKSVTQCGRASTERAAGYDACKPPTTFEYQAVDGGLSNAGAGPTLPHRPDVDADFLGAPLTLDMDGDGRDDVLFTECTETKVGMCSKMQWTLIRNGTLRSSSDNYVHRERTVSSGTGGLVPTTVYVLDYDFDGRDDVLEIDNAHHTAFNGRIRKWSLTTAPNGDEKLDFTEIGPVVAPPRTDGSVHFLDVNGDGAEDMLVCSERRSQAMAHVESKVLSWGWQLRMRDPLGGFGAATDLTLTNESGGVETKIVGCVGGAVVDVEADGKEELLLGVGTSREVARDPRSAWLLPTHSAAALLWPASGKIQLTAIPPAKDDRARMTLDVNGDSLPDVIELSNKLELYIWLNTGAGFVDRKQTFSLSAVTSSPYGGSDFQRQFLRFAQVFDENADGRADLIVRANDTTWAVLRSLGTAFAVTPITLTNPPALGDAFFVYDANGDGLRDLVSPRASAASTINAARGVGSPRMKAITDGLGARTEIEYDPAPVDGAGVYTSDGASCGYPVLCPASPGAVVKRHLVWDQPLAQSSSPIRTFTYSYSGYAVDALGRGALGFSKQTIVDSGRIAGTLPHSLTLQFANKLRDWGTGLYPLAGRVLSRTDVSFTYMNRMRVMAQANTWTLSEGEFIRPAPLSVFVAPFSTIETLVEAEQAGTNGKVLSQLTHTWDYDDYGNTTLDREQWSDGSFTQTTTDYATDSEHVSRWLISLPRLRTTSGSAGATGGQRVEQLVYPEDAGGSGVLPYTGVAETVITEPFDAPHTLTTRYTYNVYGNVTQRSATGATIDGARTRTVTIGYDAAQMFPSSLTENTGALSHTTTVAYDQGLGVAVMTSATGRPGETVVTRTIPDGFGRPRAIIEPNGAKATITYSIPAGGGGIAVRTQRAGAPTQTVTYDVLARPIRRDYDGWSAGMTVETSYNALGRPWRVSRPYSTSASDPDYTTIGYDAQGRPLTTTLPDGSKVEQCHLDNVSCTRNPRGFTSCDVLNVRGEILYSVQPQENSSAKSCTTVAGEVAAAFPFNGSAPPASAYRASKYEYDAFGELIRLEDSAHNALTYIRDGYGRVQEVTDPDAGTRRQTFNAFGETETEVEVDNNNLTAVYRYDNLGRLISRTDLGTPNQVTAYAFDSTYFGSLASSTSPDGVTDSYTYLAGGELDTLTKVIPSAPANGVAQPAQTMTRKHEYDANHRLWRVRYGSSISGTPMSVEYRYNTRGYFDRVSNASTSSPINYWTGLSVDAYGQLASERYGNNLVSTRTYLPDTGRLDVLRTTRSGTTDIQNWKHLYNENGDLRIRRNQLSGGSSETRFSYDASDRLLSAGLYPSSTNNTARYFESYTYDPNGTGNIIGKAVSGSTVSTPFSWTYEYQDGTGRPHAVKKLLVNGAVRQTYSYAKGGELATRTAGTTGMPSAVAINYNRRHMPSHLASAPGAPGGVDLQYDADGYRVHKVAGNAETFYLDEAFSRTRTIGTSGYREHLVVSAGDRSVAEVERGTTGSETIAYLHVDHLGSIEMMTNSSGTVTQQREFEAFGKRRATTGTAPFVTRGDFTGHELDSEFGLINARARLYDPIIARFLAPDPALGDPWNSQDLNPYSYVRNRPTVFTDPTGMVADGATEVATGLVVASVVVYSIVEGIRTGSIKRGWETFKETMSDIFDSIFGGGGHEHAPTRGVAASFSVAETASSVANITVNTLQGGVDLAAGVIAGANPFPFFEPSPLFGNDLLFGAGMQAGSLAGLGVDAFLTAKGTVEGALVLVAGPEALPALAIPAAEVLAGTLMAPQHLANWEKGVNYAKQAGGSDPASHGRSGRQERLRELANDPNTSSADRGWIKQEENAIERGQRTTIRNPPGKDLAHSRGREAAKGYSHTESPSQLQDRELHKTQHKFDDGGRANKERP